MVTYDTTDKVPYSADAFGTFGAINGNIVYGTISSRPVFPQVARESRRKVVGR